MAGFSSSRFAFFKFAHVNRKLPRSTHSGVTCHPTPDAAGGVTFLRIGTALDGSHRRKQAAPKRRPAGCIQENAYCFIFSQNVSGLTNRTTCPGCGETVTLPHVFAEAYPWSRTSFVLKFFSSSHE
jgi:hypothetical protein